MHYKKRKLHKLHSIPISLCNRKDNRRLYLVSYSIPLSCMVVLLLGLGLMVNLSNTFKTNAIEIDNITNGGDVGSQSAVNKDFMEGSSGNSTEGAPDSNLKDDSSGGYADELEEEMAANSDEGIMPLADTTPTASLIVGGDALDETVEVGIGEVAYRKHSVSVSVSNMLDYYLVLAGDPNLTLQDSTPTHTIPTVTANVAGAEMPDNRWGFAWEKNGSTSESALVYKPITTSNTTLESNSALATGSSVSFNGQLNFAAKFGESTVLGKYSSKVSLSLIATPKTISTTAQWVNTSGQAIGSGVDTGMMQDITDGFCQNNSNVGTGFTISLKDARDSNAYTIVKLTDDKCWMQQNLRLVAKNAEGLGLTENDTDINGNWTLPKTLVGSGTTVSGWSNSNTTPYSAYFNNINYGAYYSWCAATAGTCSGATSGSAVASSSICPKGWHLPTGGGSGKSGTGEFGVLNGLNMSSVTSKPYLFPAAGRVDNGSLGYAGSFGSYWSSTAYSDANAYLLDFNSGGFAPGTSGNPRRNGFSVRCVANY